jgi:hypothetical protein
MREDGARVDHVRRGISEPPSNGFIDYNNDVWKEIYSCNSDVDYLAPNAEYEIMLENLDGRRFIELGRG